ncbi:hypothetical protein TB1_006565 [Malus domestica]
MSMAVTGTATASSFCLTKMIGFASQSAPPCSCFKVLAVEEGLERRGGSRVAMMARFGTSKDGGSGRLERPKFDQSVVAWL